VARVSRHGTSSTLNGEWPGTSNDHTRRVQSMYGASSHRQAATSGVEDMDVICTDDPMSVLVQVGGRRALVLAQVTNPSAPGQSAPFSLPSSQAFSSPLPLRRLFCSYCRWWARRVCRLRLRSSCGSGVGGTWATSEPGCHCQPLAHAPRCWISCVPCCHLSALERGSRPALR
jgi:hypothetical protein